MADLCKHCGKAESEHHAFESAPPFALYYMRDNHTFRRLPDDISEAICVLKAEFAEGHTCGMLCSKHPSVKGVVHAHGKAEWDDFELRARQWLDAACHAPKD